MNLEWEFGAMNRRAQYTIEDEAGRVVARCWTVAGQIKAARALANASGRPVTIAARIGAGWGLRTIKPE